nr:IclR family transcriptional regulator C-terminal domain-containing protein [Haloferax sp. ATB1]
MASTTRRTSTACAASTAPVKNDETILGAISITGPSSRFTEDRLHGELADYVRSAANVIELNTKFS